MVMSGSPAGDPSTLIDRAGAQRRRTGRGSDDRDQQADRDEDDRQQLRGRRRDDGTGGRTYGAARRAPAAALAGPSAAGSGAAGFAAGRPGRCRCGCRPGGPWPHGSARARRPSRAGRRGGRGAVGDRDPGDGQDEGDQRHAPPADRLHALQTRSRVARRTPAGGSLGGADPLLACRRRSPGASRSAPRA